jgi:tRNA(Ile)-lysidine synthase
MPKRANGAERAVRDAVLAGIPAGSRVVLAVSGGRDSMVLLDAAVRWRRDSIAAVATFDHGTGPAATAACALVRSVAAGSRIVVAHQRGTDIARSEAAWRAARWAFLRGAAGRFGARVATAHTRDDHVETVFIRALRGAGARGLAGLYAPSPVLRPLLDVSRADVRGYARARNVPFVSDPSNASRDHLRNRVRLDLLPALERAHPGFEAALLSLSRRAAAWRDVVERMVDAMQPRCEADAVFVPAAPIESLPRDALEHVWPAIAGRAGVALDRRGTNRLAAFSARRSGRGPVQLSGGHEVIRHARAFEIRRAIRPAR